MRTEDRKPGPRHRNPPCLLYEWNLTIYTNAIDAEANMVAKRTAVRVAKPLITTELEYADQRT